VLSYDRGMIEGRRKMMICLVRRLFVVVRKREQGN